MNELLYYPNFNIKSETWLKYALLYVERLRPIIPYSGRNEITGATKLVFDETNLILPYQPYFQNSILASSYSIELFEKILRNERSYRRNFRLNELFDSRENPQMWDSILYSEKFTYEFGEFCVENGFANFCDGGVLMSKQLADIYMTILSGFIGEFENISTITDDSATYNVNNLVRLNRPFMNQCVDRENIRRAPVRERIAITSINQSLPCDIESISVDEIIKLRNSNGYLEKLKSFNTSMDEYIQMLSRGEYSQSFQDYLRESKLDLVSSISMLSNQFYSFMLGISFFMNNSAWSNVVGGVIQGGAVVSAAHTVCRNYQGDLNHRNSRKILADLTRVPI